MNLLKLMTADPLMFLVLVYFIFWAVVSFLTLINKRAREFFTAFYPQWFKRDGRPFTTKEKIGAAFQALMVLMIFYVLFI